MYNLFDTLTVVHKYKRLYERRCQELMKKYDLRIADIDVLYFVANSEGKNMAKDIADEGMSKANVSKAVEHLHQKGLVKLCADKEDRRCVHIEPTEDAREIVIEVENIRRNMSDSLSEGISLEDREAVARVMHRLCDNMSHELCEMEKE